MTPARAASGRPGPCRRRFGRRLPAALLLIAGAPAALGAGGARERAGTAPDCAPVRVAVAANFLDAAREAAAAFEAETGCGVLLSSGSTGQLYAQISQGAPFEVFLAADAERPARAERERLAVAGSRRTYAVGRLVLFSPDADRVLSPDTLRDPAIRRVALANPRTAPYGRAALEAARALGLEVELGKRQVFGTNVAQALSFVMTGNAEVGFVALAQVLGREGASWVVPEDLHAPIEQQAVLLERGRRRRESAAFLDFLGRDVVRRMFARRGYRTD